MAYRTYSDDELADIIGRAARIHDSPPPRRHSLADVQQIAEQVGLPPEIVAAVADDLRRGAPERRVLRALLGPSPRIMASAVVARSVTPEDYPALLDLIRAEVKAAGNASQIGQTLEWRVDTSRSRPADSMIITVTPNGDAATVRVEATLQSLHLGLLGTPVFCGAVLGLIASVEAGLAPLAVVGVTAGASLFGYTFGGASWKWFARRVATRANGLCRTLSSHLALDVPRDG